MSRKLIQFIKKDYQAGHHKFSTIDDTLNNTPIEQLVNSNIIEVFSIRNSNVGIGTMIPQVSLDTDRSDAYRIPSGTNLQRPSPAVQGYIRYNTDLSQFEGYGPGNSWGSLGGVKSTDQYTYITAELTPGANDSNLRFYTSATQQAILNPQGNLGIGTTSPLEKLHVQGNTLISGTLTTSNLTVIGDFTTLNTITSNTEQMVITNQGTGPALQVTQTGNNTVAEFYDAETGIALFIGNNGNIGIGTNSPTVALDVQGAITTNNNNINAGTATITAQTFSGTATKVSNLITPGQYILGETYDGQTARTWDIKAASNATPETLVARDATSAIYSSSLGIGTTTARSALDTIGTAIINSGNLGIGTATPAYPLHVEGASFLNGQITTNNNNINAGTGTVTAQTFSGTATKVSNLITPGQYILGETYDGQTARTWDIKAASNATPETLVARDSSSAIYSSQLGIGTTVARTAFDTIGTAIINSGNLGIGTASPQYPLHVEGQSYLNGLITTNNNNIDAGTATITAQTFSGTATKVSNLITPGQYILGETYDGQTARTWDIKAASNATPETLVARDINSAIYSSALGIGTTVARTALDTIGTAIINSGNLGIGTASPQYPLHVEGQSYLNGLITTNNNNIDAGTATITAQTFSGTATKVSNLITPGQYILGETYDGQTARTWDIKAASNATPETLVARDSSSAIYSSQLGIGTTVARTALDTIGTAIINSGNLGIGTATPAYPLHVEGQSFFNGLLSTNSNNIDAGTGTITAQTFFGTFSGGVSGTATNVANKLSPGQYILGQPFDGSNAYTWDIKASSNYSSPETLVARDASSRITAAAIAIGANSTAVALEVHSTDAILLPKGTDLQRPSPAVQGYIRYNTTTSQFEGYGAGNSWGSLGGVKSTDQYTYITAELTPGANDSNLRFYTSATQQAIINPQGNLGIGTTSPLEKLHVQGNTLISGTLTTSNLTVIGDFTTLNTITSNTEQMVITNQGTGPALQVTQTGNNTVAEFYDAETGIALFIGNNGNIGIGTNSPTVALDVQGAITTNNNNINAGTATITAQTFSGTATKVSNLITPGQYILGETYDGQTARTWDIKAASNASPETLVARDSSSAIYSSALGIGTTTARSALDTIGTAIINSGNLGIGTTAPAYPLHVEGASYLNGLITTNNNNIDAGTATITAQTFSGTATKVSNLITPGQYILGDTYDGQTARTWDIKAASNASPETLVARDSSSAIYSSALGIGTTSARSALDTIGTAIINSGNLGIGTTAPAYPLHVEGQSYLNGQITTNNNNIEAGTATITAQTFVGSFSGTATNVSNKLTPGQYILGQPFDGSNAYTWDIKASSNYSSPETLVARDAASRITASAIAIGAISTAVAFEVHSTDAILLPKGTDLERPSPATQGYIRYNTTTSQFEGYGAGNSWGSLGGVKSTDQYTYITAELTPGANDSNLRFYTSATQQAIINPQGNLGIGTTSPIEKLHVQGNTLISGTLTTSNLTVIGDFTTLNTITSNTEQMVITNQGTGPALQVTQTGNNTVAEFYDAETGIALFIGNNGNIGIGTNSPTVALDVQGAITTNNNNINAGNATITAQTFSGTATKVSNLITPGQYILGDTYDGQTARTWDIKAASNATPETLVARDSNSSIYSSALGIGTTSARTALDTIGTVIINSGNLGIGTIAPAYPLHVEGISFLNGALFTNSNNIDAGTGTISAQFFSGTFSGSATRVEKDLLAGSYILGSNYNGSIETTFSVDATTTPTANKIVARDSNAAIYVSQVGIGTTISTVALEVHSSDAILLPKGTELQRPAPASQGYIRYNTTTSQFEGYGAGNSWGSLGGVKSTDQYTYITAELTPGANDSNLRFYTSAAQQAIIDPQGNLGIGTTAPQEKLHVSGNALIEGGLFTSNFTVYQNFYYAEDNCNIRNNLQIKSARGTFLVPEGGQSNFVVNITGIYSVDRSDVCVHVNGAKLAYLNTNSNDYDISYTNNLDTTSLYVTTSKLLQQNDVVDIEVWPSYLDPNGFLQPGYIIQYLSYSHWTYAPISSNISYMIGNVGVGTTEARTALEVIGDITVTGDILPSACNVYNLGSSNYRFKDIYLSGNSINLGGTVISRDDVTGGINISDTSGNTLDFVTNNIVTSGTVSIGDSNLSAPAPQALYVIGSGYISNKLGLGSSNPLVSLEINKTDAILLPKGTTAERPDPAVQGYIRYNTSTTQFEGYGAGNSWGSLGGVKSTDQYTYITAELTPAANDSNLRFYTSGVQQAIINPSGNVGIGTTLPQEKLHVEGNIYTSSKLTASSVVTTNATIENINTSNLTVNGELQFGINAATIKTNLQVTPVRKTIYIETASSNVFYLDTPGIYTAYTSNAQVFVNQSLLMNLTDVSGDYDITSSYTSVPPRTTFVVTLINPAEYGDIVDITIWPQIIQESASQAGYVYQQVRVSEAHFDVVNTTDLSFTSGNIGIGTTSPSVLLSINNTTSGSPPSGNANDWNESLSFTGAGRAWSMGIETEGSYSLGFFNYAGITVSGTRYIRGYIAGSEAGNSTPLNFTGQHRNLDNFSASSNHIGLIVSSTGQYKVIGTDGVEYIGKDAIDINEALPIVTLTTIDSDKAVFGVISNKEDTNQSSREYATGNFISVFEKNINDTRIIVNSVGEGAIWVCDINGDIENGDYITSSIVPGYGKKQDAATLNNYTVAKITCTVVFNSPTLQQMYKVRYIDVNGTMLSLEDYNNKILQGINVYRAVFVGCTYHCG